MAEAAARTVSTADDPAVVLKGPALVAGIFVLAMANFMAVLDMTIVNVAVPHIAGGLAVSPNEGTWAITSYAVAEAIMVPLTGWLAARFGAVRVFVTAATGFGVFSALCGFSTSLSMLVVFRVLQGISGGPLMPMSQTLLLRVSPRKSANAALGLWTMTTILAPVAGPAISGVISDTIGWAWAFYINVPVAAACAMLAFRLLSSRETPIIRNPVDFGGLALLALWVGALQIMLDNGQNDDWFASPFIVALLIVAIIGFVAFLIWEFTAAHPVVDLRVYRHRGFAVASAAMAVTFGCFFGSIVLIPLWLQSNMGYTATAAGDMMAFNGVLGVVMAPVAAMLVSRMDPRILMSAGLSIIGGAILYRITFAPNMTFGQMILPQMILGLGMPLFFVPLMALSMASVKTGETATAAGLINFQRTLSGAFATALVTTFWDNTSTADRVALSGRLGQPETVLAHFRALGLNAHQALQMLDGMVQGQSVMLATNTMFLVVGGLLFAAAAGIWLIPRPAGPLALQMGH